MPSPMEDSDDVYHLDSLWAVLDPQSELWVEVELVDLEEVLE